MQQNNPRSIQIVKGTRRTPRQDFQQQLRKALTYLIVFCPIILPFCPQGFSATIARAPAPIFQNNSKQGRDASEVHLCVFTGQALARFRSHDAWRLGMLALEEDLAAATDCLLDQLPPDSEQLSWMRCMPASVVSSFAACTETALHRLMEEN
jgi:hypothetical protein